MHIYEINMICSSSIKYMYRIISAYTPILSSAGTGQGIIVVGSSDYRPVIINNLVEGFSGAGGIGISTSILTDRQLPMVSFNGCYNNTTNYSHSSDYHLSQTDNEALGASPFAKNGVDSFANRFNFFEPVAGGNVIGGAYPDAA
jgi:hypothetical protein